MLVAVIASVLIILASVLYYNIIDPTQQFPLKLTWAPGNRRVTWRGWNR